MLSSIFLLGSQFGRLRGWGSWVSSCCGWGEVVAEYVSE